MPDLDNKISISLASRTSTKPTTNGTKRSHASLTTEDDDEHTTFNEQSAQITSFGADNGIRRAKTPPRVISPLVNRSWRGDRNEQRKRQKSGLPTEARPIAEDEEHKIDAGDKKYGLQILERRRSQTEPSITNGHAEGEENTDTQQKTDGAPVRTLEDEALASLKGERSAVNDSHAIAPVSAGDEDAAFRRDFSSAPAEPTLAEYDSTPVDGYGAALLRGYLEPGQILEKWKEGQEAKMLRSRKGASGKGVEKKREGRRPDLLGMGAKEMDLPGKEVNGREGFKRKQEQKEYAPLARVNKKTGEILSENDFRDRVEKQEEKGRTVQTSGASRLETKGRSRDLNEWEKQRDATRHRERERSYDSDRGKEQPKRNRDRYYEDSRDRRYRQNFDGHNDRHDSKSRRHRDRLREDDRHRR